MIRLLHTLTRIIFIVIVLVVVIGGAGAGAALVYFGRDLPDSNKLKSYVPAIGSKVYAGDGSLMADFAAENRVFVPIGKIPAVVKDAFLAAEDRDFYTHKGVNPGSVLRAAATDLMRMGHGERPIGASTITQQVVRHFLLTNQVSVSRKVKEILLAYRIDGQLSKDRILEIYLNEIYLGAGAYGVAAAADTYFQTPLDKLTPAQAAFLAALPKAPNNYNPVKFPQQAKARRDWVLASMAETGAINQAQAKAAIQEPLGIKLKPAITNDRAPGYFAEEVRRELVARFGEKAVYEGGLVVHTSFQPKDQAMANRAFHDGLVAYDRRHGWRGPVKHLGTPAAAEAALLKADKRPGVATWQLAAVTRVEPTGAEIVVHSGARGFIPASELSWARRTLPDQRLGPLPRLPGEVLQAGDVIFVEPLGKGAPVPASTARRGAAPARPLYGLRQVPDVDGGFVVLDPKTGRVMAMVGGWDYTASQFNRVTQAWRQPGSAIKPLVYVTAMENGFTPDSVVDDSPIELSQGPGLPPWRPVNYEGTSGGPSTLRDALIHSKNLVTARLATMIGMPSIAKTVESFDIMDRMPLYYSMALGAGDTTLLRLATAYGMLDNGGHWLLPSMIDTVQDRTGQLIYQKGVGTCASCYADAATTGSEDPEFKAAGAPDSAEAAVPNVKFAANAVLYKPTRPDPLVTQEADYQIISMMQGVVQQGTGIEVAAVGKPLAGKTGTTNGFNDAWFVGFSPDLVAGGFVGFDGPRTLGTNETGGHVSAPIFRDFMEAALKDAPPTPFPAPPNAEPAIASRDNGQSGYGSTAPDPNAQANHKWQQSQHRKTYADETGAGASDDNESYPGDGYPGDGNPGGNGYHTRRALPYGYADAAAPRAPAQYQAPARPSEYADGPGDADPPVYGGDRQRTGGYRGMPGYRDPADDRSVPAGYGQVVEPPPDMPRRGRAPRDLSNGQVYWGADDDQ